MHLNYEKLIGNQKAFDKYSERKCVVFCLDRQLWISLNGYTKDKMKAKVRRLVNWRCHLEENYNAEIHFISALGESSTPDLKEMNEDDIYNDVRVRFDRFTTKFGK